MKYLRTRMATDWSRRKSLKIYILDTLFWFVPRANPGYEKKMHLLAEWLVEFDEEGLPWREIGLDMDGRPVLAGPSDECYGFWLDTNMRFDDFEGEPVAGGEFERLWLLSGVNVSS
jgi:hypothetical protein